MVKRRYTPRVVAPKKAASPQAAVFDVPRNNRNDRQERFERFFPGVETAANERPRRPGAGAPAPTGTRPEASEDPHAEASDADTSEAQAQDPLVQAFEQAAQEGFAAGLAQAQEQTQARIDEHMKNMDRMLQSVVDLRREAFAAYQSQCLELALAGAEALARRSFHADREPMSELIRDALGELSDEHTILLHVCTEHAQELEAWVRERFAQQQVQVVAEADMGPEDFRAVCKTGSVTGDFEQRLLKLRESIFQHRGQLDPPEAS